MGWVKLDDGFPNHPKVVVLSLEAKWAYVEALCYAACYRTDGDVPDAVAAKGPVRAELMASGLWESQGTASAIRIHDYLAYNWSRADYEAKAVAGAIGGAAARGEALAQAVPSRPVPKPDISSFEAFWTAYPRRVGKPKARTAYRRALARATDKAIIAGAERYRDDPNRTDEYTAHPTTWLNRDGWDDAPLPSHKNGSGPVKELRPYDHVDWDKVAR